MINLNKIIFKMLEDPNDWRLTLFNSWENIVGSLKTHICLEKLEGTTVIIGVYEQHWMQELYLMSNVILKKINLSIGSPRISNVRFKLIEQKKIFARKFNAQAQNDQQASAPVVNLSSNEKNALNKISDENLKKCLLNYYCMVKAY